MLTHEAWHWYFSLARHLGPMLANVLSYQSDCPQGGAVRTRGRSLDCLNQNVRHVEAIFDRRRQYLTPLVEDLFDSLFARGAHYWRA